MPDRITRRPRNRVEPGVKNLAKPVRGRPPKPPLVAPGVGPSVRIETAYERAVVREIVNPMLRETRERVRHAQDWLSAQAAAQGASLPLGDKPERLAQAWRTAVQGDQAKKFTRAMRRFFGVQVEFMSESGVAGFMDQKVRDNVALIKTMPEWYKARLETVMQRDFLRSRPFDRQLLYDTIRHSGVSTAKRAKLIARDQTAKAVSQLNQIRNQNLGIEEYVWSSSGDSRVRPEHVAYDGLTFSWESPPPDGNPGEPVRCRCIAQPIIPRRTPPRR